MKQIGKVLLLAGVAGVVFGLSAGATTVVSEIVATLRPDVTISVDGIDRTFVDANDQAVYPIVYEGSTYLPVRAVGELMGKTVTWDGDTNTVILSGGTPSVEAVTPGGYITQDMAKAYALTHAGLSLGNVVFTEISLDVSGAIAKYELEFWADNVEYEYQINATTGAMLYHEWGGKDPGLAPDTSAYIGSDAAKEIALTAAGLTLDEVTAIYANLDLDDDDAEYEVEFHHDGRAYHYEINGITGTILTTTWEAEDHIQIPETAQFINQGQAMAVALIHAGLTIEQVTFETIELDTEDDDFLYELEFYTATTEYEYEVDAVTGLVRSYEWEER